MAEQNSINNTQLNKSNNLSDLPDASTARTNLGLGTLATQNGTFSGTSSGTNTGDQTSIVGITGTKAQFDTAVTDGNFLYVGDVTQYTDEMAQDAVGAMVDTTLVYTDATPLLSRAALTGAITASAGSNTTSLGSFTLSQLNTALSDADVATGGGTATGTNTGDQTITLTGAVTGSGTGSFSTTLASSIVGISNLSATGTPSATTYLRGDNTWATIAAGGDVTKVGTPVDNQIGVWTGDGTIEGDTNLTFDTSTDTFTTVNARLTKVGIGATVDANRLLLVQGDVAGGIATINRTTASTTGTFGTLIVKATSSGQMTSGFGPAISFAVQDADAVENSLAIISATRGSSSDAVGSLTFAVGGISSIIIPGDTGSPSFTTPVGMGNTVADPESAISLNGSISGLSRTLSFAQQLSPLANRNVYGIFAGGTVTTPATGTHTLIAQGYFSAPNVTSGGASVTNTATIYASGQSSATVTGTNYALWIDSGLSAFGGNVVPDVNDVAALGTTALSWSDLFLASGAVINFNNGNATLTHSASLLTSNVDIAVPDEAYAVGWNGSLEVPTKNAVYDKIETLPTVSFSTIAVSGQSNVIADSASDTLTLVAGTNITITTDAATDSITINSSGGSGISGLTAGRVTLSASSTTVTDDAGFTYDTTADYFKVGAGTPTVTLGSGYGAASVKAGGNTFYQAFFGQSTSTGTLASTDFILQNDSGTTTTNYLDIGIASSNNSDGNYSISGAGSGYMYNQSGVLAIGTAGNNELRFHTGGTTSSQRRMMIAGNASTVTIGLAGTSTGSLALTGATSGTATITVGAAAGTPTLTLPTTTDTLVGRATTDTLTNKRITKRIQSTASAATVTPSWDNDDMVDITAQAAGLTLANPTGTPTNGQPIIIRIRDNGTTRTIGYGSQYSAVGVTLPTATTANKVIILGGQWNSNLSRIDVTAVAQEA